MSELRDPRQNPDPTGLNVVAGLSFALYVVMFGVALVLHKHRHWPPIQAKNLPLLQLPLLYGTVNFAGFLLWTNFIPGDPLCVNSVLNGIGIPGLVACLLVRMYRLHAVLVQYRTTMWSGWKQTLVLVAACCWVVPLRIATLGMRPGTLQCYIPPGSDLGWINLLYVPGIFLQVIAGFYYAHKLRRVAIFSQEVQQTKFALRWISFCCLIFLPLNSLFTDPNRTVLMDDIARLGLLLLSDLMTVSCYCTFTVGLARRAASGDTTGLEQYIPRSNELNLTQLEQIQERDLEKYLKDDQMRTALRAFATTRYSAELIDFSVALMQLDQCTEYHRRQATSMMIIDRFIRPESEQQINIDAKLREKILASDISHPDAFDGARREVLALISSNLIPEFRNSAQAKLVTSTALQRVDELERLRSAGFTVGGSGKEPTSPPSASKSSKASKPGFGALSSASLSRFSRRSRASTGSGDVSPGQPPVRRISAFSKLATVESESSFPADGPVTSGHGTPKDAVYVVHDGME